MQIKVILLEPKYQINLGYVARTAMNFGVKKIYVVKPRAKLTGAKARMFSKHAYGLLESAKVYKNLDDATNDCDLIIGTTGIRQKGKANYRKTYFAEDAIRKIKKGYKNKKIALIIGRDDIGLKSDEVRKCDMLAYISTDPAYPVLNLSHALAIFLYLIKKEKLRLCHEEGMEEEKLSGGEMKMLLTLFKKLIENKKIRDKDAVLGIFKRILRDAQPSKQELHALITALK